MRTFRCTFREPSGKIQNDRIEADSQAQIIELLSAKDCLILSITEESKIVSRRQRGSRKVRQDDIVIIVRQLSTMIDAGIPLLQCLQTLEDQTEPGRLRDVLHGLVEDVTHGRSFSESLANHPVVFDNLFVNMVRAGEAGGFLSEVLDRLATHLEEAAALKRKVKSALMYPTIVMAIAFAILRLLIVKVIPVFESMYMDFGAVLPLPTRILIAMSHFTRDWGLLMLVGGVALFYLLRWYRKTSGGRLFFDRLVFNLPVFGELVQKVSIARFATTLAALVGSGVSIIQSLEIVSDAAGNEIIRRVLKDATRRTEKGDPIADALRDSPYIPRMVCKMIEIGETTGRLDSLLNRVGAFYTEQVNTSVNGLTSLIEPMMIVFLGVVVGGVMLSMFMPIFQLSTVV